jgi:hypothetical protein
MLYNLIKKIFKKQKKETKKETKIEHGGPDLNKKLIATLVFRDGTCKYMYENEE